MLPKYQICENLFEVSPYCVSVSIAVGVIAVIEVLIALIPMAQGRKPSRADDMYTKGLMLTNIRTERSYEREEDRSQNSV